MIRPVGACGDASRSWRSEGQNRIVVTKEARRQCRMPSAGALKPTSRRDSSPPSRWVPRPLSA